MNEKIYFFLYMYHAGLTFFVYQYLHFYVKRLNKVLKHGQISWFVYFVCVNQQFEVVYS